MALQSTAAYHNQDLSPVIPALTYTNTQLYNERLSRHMATVIKRNAVSDGTTDGRSRCQGHGFDP